MILLCGVLVCVSWCMGFVLGLLCGGSGVFGVGWVVVFLYALVWFVLVFAEATFAGLRCGFVTDFVGVGCCVVFVWVCWCFGFDLWVFGLLRFWVWWVGCSFWFGLSFPGGWCLCACNIVSAWVVVLGALVILSFLRFGG